MTYVGGEGGGGCGSSNQHASAHCCARPGMLGDRVTASPDSLVLLSCGVCSSVHKL